VNFLILNEKDDFFKSFLNYKIMAKIDVNIKNENIKYKISFTNNIVLYLKQNIKDIDNKKLLFVFDSNVYKIYFKK
jgi:hypothetical protein